MSGREGEWVMIRIIKRTLEGDVTVDLPLEALRAALDERGAMVWIDMMAPTHDEYHLILEQTFHFHPLAIEDTISDMHLPKVDDYGAYLYLVFHTVSLGDQPMDLDTEEVDVFLGARYLITIHESTRRSIDRCWHTEYHTIHGLARSPALLLYELLDSQIDNYIPIIDAFEEKIEQLGDDIFAAGENQRSLLDRLLTAKSSALRLQRILAPQRELLNRLATTSYTVIRPEERIYFRDAYDHLARLANLSESMRDLSSSTIETHLALVNNRMNEVMKVLTIISTIFIPLSFIAGIYGMNFVYMPELEWRFGYLFVWLIFLAVAATMLMFFRRRKWI
jgi:magnesium transporter